MKIVFLKDDCICHVGENNYSNSQSNDSEDELL